MSNKLHGVYSAIGASSHAVTDRDSQDFYSTPRMAIECLLKEYSFTQNVLEPACGDGAISKVLEEHGYHVTSMDLYDRGYGTTGIDFLTYDTPFHGDIITNPPYKLAQQFIEHGLEIIDDECCICVLLPLRFLESRKRQSLFDKMCLSSVLVFRKRISCYLSGEYANYNGAVAFAWFIFRKSFYGNPVIIWIN